MLISLVMIMRRWSSPARDRIIPSQIFTVLVPAWLVPFFIISTFFTVSNSSAASSGPIYEEIYSVKDDLTGTISKIDYAIYEALFRSGTHERDIFFLDVQSAIPKKKSLYLTLAK